MSTELHFGLPKDPESQPRRARTLLISIGVHVLLVVFLAFNPSIFSSAPKRIIRIAGQDYDLAKVQELYLPPRERPPAIADNRPLVQPPMPAPQPPPPAQPQPNTPPPPPPPPPSPQQPPAVISPDDVIAEGARPDAQPKPSRGNTAEAARAGGETEKSAAPKPEPPKASGEKGETQIASNANPNALRLPNLLDRAGRIVNQTIEESTRRGARSGGQTGLPNVQENPNFATEEPTILSDTKGYDFGPYMNQVINRVRLNWYSLIPEAARLGRRGRVVVVFTILKNGGVFDLRLVANSGADPLDRAATGAIQASNPFPQLPTNFDGDHLVLQFTFLYNLR